MNERELIQILDGALAEAARRSGAWLACKPGCAQCCVGVFSIGETDAARLRRGLKELASADPDRAACVQQRARAAADRLAADFPGDAATGILDTGGGFEERFDEFGNEEVCPALDPDTLTCDLYSARPITCRTFGPAMHVGEGMLTACELCYQGASEEEMLACAVELDVELISPSDAQQQTIVAFALLY